VNQGFILIRNQVTSFSGSGLVDLVSPFSSLTVWIKTGAVLANRLKALSEVLHASSEIEPS